jgi:hypothetical protein
MIFWAVLGGCTSSPAPRAVIEGVVTDAVGTPLVGVKVHVLKSAYATETDDKGRYSVPFAPGAFQVAYRHGDYADEVIDLNIQVVTRFPSEVVALVPKGVEGELVVLTTKGARTISSASLAERLSFAEHRSIRSWRCPPQGPVLGAVGTELVFTDRTGLALQLAELGRGGVVLTDDRAPASVAYNGLRDAHSTHVGEHGVLVHQLTPAATGFYAWVAVDEAGGRLLEDGEACYPFEVR